MACTRSLRTNTAAMLAMGDPGPLAPTLAKTDLDARLRWAIKAGDRLLQLLEETEPTCGLAVVDDELASFPVFDPAAVLERHVCKPIGGAAFEGLSVGLEAATEGRCVLHREPDGSITLRERKDDRVIFSSHNCLTCLLEGARDLLRFDARGTWIEPVTIRTDGKPQEIAPGLCVEQVVGMEGRA